MINLVERKFNDVKGSRLGPASPTVTMGLIAGRADLPVFLFFVVEGARTTPLHFLTKVTGKRAGETPVDDCRGEPSQTTFSPDRNEKGNSGNEIERNT